MRRAHDLLRFMALSFTAMMGALFVISACSSKSSLVGPGGECFLATDCAPGLVCVEQQNKTRVCSDDLSRVAGRPPPEAGPADANADAPDAPAVQDTGPVQDTGTPPVDTGTPPPVDSGNG